MAKTEGATSTPHLTSAELSTYEKLVKAKQFEAADELAEQLVRLALMRAASSATTQQCVSACNVIWRNIRRKAPGKRSRSLELLANRARETKAADAAGD